MKRKTSDDIVAAFNTPMVLHSNQKYRQNTIEFSFVNSKDQSRQAKFIDLLGFLQTH